MAKNARESSPQEGRAKASTSVAFSTPAVAVHRVTRSSTINNNDKSPPEKNNNKSTKFVTPKTTRSSSSASKFPPPVPNHLWTSRTSTCISFGLDPSNRSHFKIMCDECNKYCNITLGGIVALHTNKKYPRPGKYLCSQPWSHKFKDHDEIGKRLRYKDFHEYFVNDTGLCNENDGGEVQKKRGRDEITEGEDNAVVSPGDKTPGEDTQPSTKKQRTFTVLNKRDCVTEEAVDAITDAVMNRKRKRLTENEKKLTAVLMQRMIDEQEAKSTATTVTTVTLPGIKMVGLPSQPYKMARVPVTYSTTIDGKERHRTTSKRYGEIVEDWNNTLPGDMKAKMTSIMFNSDPSITKECVVKYWNANCRVSPRKTAAICSFAGMNNKVTERFTRSLAFETGGLRVLASAGKVAAVKKEYIAEQFTTLQFNTKTLKRRVNAGKTSYTRDMYVQVTTINPLEHLINTVQETQGNGTFVHHTERFRVPFTKDDKLDDVALEKFGADSGAGSFKINMNLVNNNKPQGQEFVLPVCEFKAKDTYDNVKAAVFYDGSVVKYGMNSIINRKVVLLKVTIKKVTRISLAINTSASHNYKKPSALPKPNGTEQNGTPSATRTMKDRVKNCIVEIDFTLVQSTKLQYDKTNKVCEGISFFDSSSQCIAVSYFMSPINCSVEDITSQVIDGCRQILVAGVLTADLEFLSTFFGHQGASATWPCLFCLIKNNQLTRIFQGGTIPSYTQRTLQTYKQDHKEYHTRFECLSLTDQKKSKARSNVTVKYSHSVHRKSLDEYEFDAVTKAPVHDILGFTRTMVDWIQKSLRALEKKVASYMMGDNDALAAVQLVETVEKTLNDVITYENFLKKHLKDDVAEMQVYLQQENILDELIDNTTKQLENEHISNDQRTYYTKVLSDLNEKKQQAEDNLNNPHMEDDINIEKLTEYKTYVLEQLQITKQTRQELELYLKNHEGHSARVVIASLKKYGVDVQVYHSGAIIGNHCMLFAQRGDNIMDAIKKGMLPYMSTEQHKSYLEKFCTQMKEMIRLWYELQRVMKSTGLQSDETIEQFKKNRDKLRDCIYKFIVTDVPIPDTGIKLPTAIKTHIIFGNHLLEQLVHWGTLGGLDEQNIESAHAIWNELMRRFGACRGLKQKQLVMKQFLFDRASFVHEDKRDMIEGTTRKKGARYGTTKKNSEQQPAEEDTTMEEEDDDVEETAEELAELEKGINESDTLHPYREERQVEEGDEPWPVFDTHVRVCNVCSKRILACALKIHMHESHSGDVEEEADGAHDQAMILAASGRS